MLAFAFSMAPEAEAASPSVEASVPEKQPRRRSSYPSPLLLANTNPPVSSYSLSSIAAPCRWSAPE